MMTVYDGMSVFVKDFVKFHHPDLGETTGKVLRVFQKVLYHF